MIRENRIYDDGTQQPAQQRMRPVRPRTLTAGATTVAGAPRPPSTASSAIGAMTQRPRIGTPTAPGARPMAPGSQAPAPIRSAAPGSILTSTAQPTTPGGAQDPNLRDQVFTPGGDPRLQGAQNATDAAASATQTGASYNDMAQRFRPVENGRYSAEQDQALAALGGPNRTELARQALADFDETDAENRHNRYRQIGQNAARLGRLGMGDTGQEVVNQGRIFEADRARYANELARGVAEGDIGDRFRRVDVTSGLRGQESDIDARLRGEGRDIAGTELDDRYRRLGAAAGYETDVFNQGRANRDEFRGERGRQDDLAQRGIDNRVTERQIGNSEMDQRFRQALARFAMGQEGIPRLDELLKQHGGA